MPYGKEGPFDDQSTTSTLIDLLFDNRKKNPPDEKPIFQNVAMLATALGPNLTRHMHEVLDLMFQWGLTEPLRQALVAIARHIPPLLRSIQGETQ
jgi:hypothetical protein